MKLHFIHRKKECIVMRVFSNNDNKKKTINMLGWFCSKCGKTVGEKYLFILDEDIKKNYPNLEWREENK